MITTPLLVTDGRILTGDGSPLRYGSLLILPTEQGGVFADPESREIPKNCRRLSAEGKVVMPVLADIGCHFFDPAHSARDSLETASRAALGGGFGIVCCEPDENGRPLTKEAVGSASCRLLPALPLPSPEEILRNGKRIYSASGCGKSDLSLKKAQMEACAATGSLYLSLPCSRALAGNGAVAPGRTALLSGLPVLPASAETTAAAEDILLALDTGCRLHLTCIGSALTAELVGLARRQGGRVTCGTSPLHLAMTEGDVVCYGANAKIFPPLSSERNREALSEALAEGGIDCVSSLHTPFTKAEKNNGDLLHAPFGASGLDTALAAFLTYTAGRGDEALLLAASLLSVRPAAILGRDTRLLPGNPADFMLFNPARELIVSSQSLRSKSRNTPFLGLTLRGFPEALFIGGERML